MHLTIHRPGPNNIPGHKLLRQQAFAQGVLQQTHHRPLQRPRAIFHIKASLRQQLNHTSVQLQIQLLRGQPLLQIGRQQTGNLLNLRRLQAAEHQHIVNPVDKLRPKSPLHRLHRSGFHLFIFRFRLGFALVAGGKAQRIALYLVGAQIGGHNNYGVAEIHRAAFAVGQAAVVQHLQQHVKNIRVGLFNLIQQHHAVGAAAHRLRQLAALVVPHIAGRRANQPGHGVLLHIFAHIQTNHRVVAAKQSVGQSFGKLGFAHARRPHKDERTNRPFGVFQTGAAAAHRFGHLHHGLILADNPLVQQAFQLQQLLHLRFLQLSHRNTAPVGKHLGNLLRVHLAGRLAVILLPGLLALLKLLAQGVLTVTPFGGFLKVLGAGGGVLFFQNILQLLLQLPQLLGRGLAGQVHHRRGFVHQINGFVRQVTVRQITHRESDGSLNRLGRNLHAVVRLVAVAQALQNSNGFLLAGFVHRHRLKTPLQRRVLFNIFAIFVNGGCAHALQLAPGQGRLQDISSVNRALRAACANQRVQLVNKEDDFAGFADFLHHLLQTLLKLAPIFCARQQAGYIQGNNAFIRQRLRHRTSHNSLRQPLRNSGFAHARLANQHRVIFGTAGKDLHHPLNF